jgi:hypothetical protein
VRARAAIIERNGSLGVPSKENPKMLSTIRSKLLKYFPKSSTLISFSASLLESAESSEGMLGNTSMSGTEGTKFTSQLSGRNDTLSKYSGSKFI